jgi:hypothetical protein
VACGIVSQKSQEWDRLENKALYTCDDDTIGRKTLELVLNDGANVIGDIFVGKQVALVDADLRVFGDAG